MALMQTDILADRPNFLPRKNALARPLEALMGETGRSTMTNIWCVKGNNE